MKKITYLASALMLACAATSAHAISVFSSQDDFLNALTLNSISFTTLDFETQSAGDVFNSGDTIDGATFTFPIEEPLVIDDFFPTTSGTNFLGVNDSTLAFFGGDSFTVSAGETLRAAGMYIIGEPSSNVAGDFTLTTDNGDSAINTSVADQQLFDDLGDETGAAFFIGLIADDPSEWFDSFTLSSLSLNFLYNIDDITYGTTAVNPIPLPATIWLFAAALIGLFGFGRKRLAEL